jgi:hypothetical protein
MATSASTDRQVGPSSTLDEALDEDELVEERVSQNAPPRIA